MKIKKGNKNKETGFSSIGHAGFLCWREETVTFLF